MYVCMWKFKKPLHTLWLIELECGWCFYCIKSVRVCDIMNKHTYEHISVKVTRVFWCVSLWLSANIYKYAKYFILLYKNSYTRLHISTPTIHYYDFFCISNVFLSFFLCIYFHSNILNVIFEIIWNMTFLLDSGISHRVHNTTIL